MTDAAVAIAGLSHRYGDRLALDGIDLDATAGQIFGLLGPNGGGKSTLFRILTTALPIQAGQVTILGTTLGQTIDAPNMTRLRQQIGVVFQHPSLDKKLTVAENLLHHCRLYHLPRAEHAPRIDRQLGRFGLADRRSELVEKLSGGLARRVELAKALLHDPKLLIMDEPSTGLDPGARLELWAALRQLQADGVTTLVTTHLLEEAERCDRLAIIDRGKIVAVGQPDELRAAVGADTLTLVTDAPIELADRLKQLLQLDSQVEAKTLRVRSTSAWDLVGPIVHHAGPLLQSLSISRPTLEDVFLQRTGHSYWSEERAS